MSQPQPETFPKEVVELAGELYHANALTETNDETHKIIQRAFWKHDRRLVDEHSDAIASGLDASAAWDCVLEEIISRPNPLSESEVMKTDTPNRLPVPTMHIRQDSGAVITGGANSEQNTREDLSATPRTTMVIKKSLDENEDALTEDLIEHSRTLERENNQLRKELGRETAKLITVLDVCREEGWNGVENSKCADTFLRTLFAELRQQLSDERAKLAEAERKLSVLKPFLAHSEFCKITNERDCSCGLDAAMNPKT